MKRKWWTVCFLSILAGSALHFLYDLWPNPLTAVFAPVNESVWEHLKLLYWPFLAAAFVLTKDEADGRKSWCGLLAGLLGAPLLLLGAYYTLLSGFTLHGLPLDLILYALAMAGGFALAWLSDRVAEFDHYRLLGKAKNDWEIGSPATAQFAAVQQIIEYVVALGKVKDPDETDRRALYEAGMKRIADHERGLLELMLDGTDKMPGLRHMEGVTVRMDGKDLTTRDLILGIELANIPCEQAVKEYDKRGIVTFDRSASSLYSRRMLDAFGLKGVVRLSPLHVNSVEDIEEFLQITADMVKAAK